MRSDALKELNALILNLHPYGIADAIGVVVFTPVMPHQWPCNGRDRIISAFSSFSAHPGPFEVGNFDQLLAPPTLIAVTGHLLQKLSDRGPGTPARSRTSPPTALLVANGRHSIGRRPGPSQNRSPKTQKIQAFLKVPQMHLSHQPWVVSSPMPSDWQP